MNVMNVKDYGVKSSWDGWKLSPMLATKMVHLWE
jgi:hypothetical protein